MKKLENEVQGSVVRLLAMLEPTCDTETFLFVRDKLTRMVIVSVPPPGCNTTTQARRTAEVGDDFSAKKESFIAP